MARSINTVDFVVSIPLARERFYNGRASESVPSSWPIDLDVFLQCTDPEEEMQTKPQLDQNAPWKQRFRASTIAGTQLARLAPDRGLAVSNQSGTYQLYAWDVSCGQLRQLTNKPEGVVFGSISPDGRHVYFQRDEHGNEVGHWVRVPFEGGETEDISPSLPEYSSWGFGFSPDSRSLIFLAVYGNVFHVYRAAIGADDAIGDPELLHRSPAFLGNPILSSDGALAVVGSTERSGKLQFSLLAFDLRSGNQHGDAVPVPIAELWDGPETSVAPIAFSPVPGDVRVLATSDRSGDARPLLWNPLTGERTDFDLDDFPGEVAAFDWSPDGSRVLLCQFHQAVQQLFLYDVNDGSVQRINHPAGTVSAYFASDSEIFARWQDSVHPPRVIALDIATGQETRTLLAGGDAPPGHRWRSVTFLSSDGQPIQAWLGEPAGDGPFVTILDTHGGPEAVTTESYAPRGQVWLDHGFAYLSVNYRGSTTFGREFKEKIWRDPGHWEIEDMAAAYRWLVENGIARPDAVFVTGWSYGGYNTLQAIGVKPELWAGGMAGVAVADWVSQFEDESDTMRGVDVPFMGGTPDEAPEVYRTASPITYCEQVRAPVVIIQGHNDTRCPPRQVALYEARMRELGKPCEVHWFDAGHLIGPVEQAIEHAEIFLRFVYRVLNGSQ
jgi:dipeptidyl aminopeptidase/acylaminoacyl peptidase